MDRFIEMISVKCKPSQDFEQAGLSTYTDLCYGYRGFYMTQDPLAIHLLEVDALNVEEDMDLLPSLKFLAHNTGRRLSQLEGRLAGKGCSLRDKFPPKKIRRWRKEEMACSQGE